MGFVLRIDSVEKEFEKHGFSVLFHEGEDDFKVPLKTPWHRKTDVIVQKQKDTFLFVHETTAVFFDKIFFEDTQDEKWVKMTFQKGYDVVGSFLGKPIKNLAQGA
jgi:hypothetical protein